MKTRPHTCTILTVAVMMRLIVLWAVIVDYPPDWLYSRGIELGILAQSLAGGHGLSSPFGGSTGATALLAPGYPIVIAGFFRVFGAFSMAAAIAIMLAQLLFSVLTVFLIVQVAHQLYGSLAADIAGFFWAVSLPLIWMPTIFWETCLSTLLLLGMIAAALRFPRGPAAVMGAYTALAALVNPALLPALLAIVGWMAWQQREKRWYLPLALLVFSLMYAPWPLRNQRELHAFIPLRSTLGLEMWMGNHPSASGFLEEAQFPIFNHAEYNRYAALGEAGYMRDKAAVANTYIRTYPGTFLRMSALRVVRFWTGTGNRNGSVFFTLHALLTTTLGVAGLWRLFASGRMRVALLFLLPLLLFPLPYYITHAEFRYRLVIDPLLTILAVHCAEKH
jgi:4-amino-4-deoxy-L-arabinose transferase-like glycosyltransferase